jgi:uncharacterized protein YfaS (alpha-2-macroglobulin family)
MAKALSGNYDRDDFTFGSSLRDKAVVLQAYALTGNVAQALPTALEVAGSINNGHCSTQEAAFAAMAMDRLFAKVGTQTVKATVGGKEVTSAKSVYTQPVSGKVDVQNTADGLLYATMTKVGKAPAGTPVAAASNALKIEVTYKDAEGNAVNPASIPQGKEFTASVKVTNPTQNAYTSLALSERIPSGWEILNDRLRTGVDNGGEHRDIRDDRCDWFFDLGRGASKTFNLKLRAAYEGVYTLPAVTCSAMYNPHVAANTASGQAAVTR